MTLHRRRVWFYLKLLSLNTEKARKTMLWNKIEGILQTSHPKYICWTLSSCLSENTRVSSFHVPCLSNYFKAMQSLKCHKSILPCFEKSSWSSERTCDSAVKSNLTKLFESMFSMVTPLWWLQKAILRFL